MKSKRLLALLLALPLALSVLSTTATAEPMEEYALGIPGKRYAMGRTGTGGDWQFLTIDPETHTIERQRSQQHDLTITPQGKKATFPLTNVVFSAMLGKTRRYFYGTVYVD